MIGELHGADALFMREQVGSAKDPTTGAEYELDVQFASKAPVIRSRASGRWWTISWPQLLALAIESGINQPEHGGHNP